MFGMLTAIAVILTYAMFQSRNAMLGFPSAIFWALLGGYCFQQSVVTWDLYYIFGFACLLGMTVFCMFAAYGLREKRDAIGEQSMEKGGGERIGEETEKKDESFYADDGMPDLDENLRAKPKPGKRVVRRKKRRGEFGF